MDEQSLESLMAMKLEERRRLLLYEVDEVIRREEYAVEQQEKLGG